MRESFKRLAISPWGFLLAAFLTALNAEFDYRGGSKNMAYVFAALTVALCLRAWRSWRRQNSRPIP